MSLKMKKRDVAIAYSIIALILGSVLMGLASCPMGIDGLDIGTPSQSVNTGTVVTGGFGGSAKIVPNFSTVPGGYTRPAVISYYNSAATLNVNINTYGELEYDSGTAPTGAVKSLTLTGPAAGGSPEYLIGRAPSAHVPIKLKLETDGALSHRDAVGDSVPIGSYAEFQLISTGGLGNKYKLEANLDLMSVEWTPVGSTAPFTGTFNGKEKKLSNLKIDKTGDNDVGLFGVVGGTGKVMGLGILSGSVKGNNNVGALVGSNNGGAIFACYNVGVSVNGAENVGGVAGTSSGDITACYNQGPVKGGDVGGLVGYFGSSIDACYNAGTLYGSKSSGGVVGFDDGGTGGTTYWKDQPAISGSGFSAGVSFPDGGFPSSTGWAADDGTSGAYWKSSTLSGGSQLSQLWYEQ